MIIKMYQKNIIYSYIKNILIVSIIFLSLAFFLNILEEIRFFKNTNANIQMMKRAGFKDISTVFKFLNFEGYLAIK